MSEITNQTQETTTRSPLPDALTGQAVLIIGGSSGIGAAAARLLAGIGADVTVASRSGRLPEGLSGPAGTAHAASVDVTDEESLRALLDAQGRLDHVLVTAAALAAGPVADTPYEQIRGTFESWLKGAYLVAQLAGPRLAEEGGSLTLTSAGGAVRPLPGTVAASGAVAGVEAMARALALELAPARVNAVRPGPADTPLLHGFLGTGDAAAVAAFGAGMPLGRVARPEEVAAAALFLMSNPYVTGSVVTVDGGGSLA